MMFLVYTTVSVLTLFITPLALYNIESLLTFLLSKFVPTFKSMEISSQRKIKILGVTIIGSTFMLPLVLCFSVPLLVDNTKTALQYEKTGRTLFAGVDFDVTVSVLSGCTSVLLSYYLWELGFRVKTRMSRVFHHLGAIGMCLLTANDLFISGSLVTLRCCVMLIIAGLTQQLNYIPALMYRLPGVFAKPTCGKWFIFGAVSNFFIKSAIGIASLLIWMSAEVYEPWHYVILCVLPFLYMGWIYQGTVVPYLFGMKCLKMGSATNAQENFDNPATTLTTKRLRMSCETSAGDPSPAAFSQNDTEADEMDVDPTDL